jgi:hypothetical protein
MEVIEAQIYNLTAVITIAIEQCILDSNAGEQQS